MKRVTFFCILAGALLAIVGAAYGGHGLDPAASVGGAAARGWLAGLPEQSLLLGALLVVLGFLSQPTRAR